MQAYPFNDPADDPQAGSAPDPPAPPVGAPGPDPAVDACPLPDPQPRPDQGPAVPPRPAAAMDLPEDLPAFLTKLERLTVRALTRITPLDRPRFDDREKPVLRLIQRNHWRNRERFPGLQPVHTYHLASLVIGTLGQAGSLPIREFHRRCNRLHRQAYGALVPKHRIQPAGLGEFTARTSTNDPLVHQTLQLLDAETRALLTQRYLGPQKRRTKDLAAEYGLSRAAMGQRLARARTAFQRLDQKLKKLGELEG